MTYVSSIGWLHRQTLNGQTLCQLSEHLYAEDTSHRDFWQHFLTDLKGDGSDLIVCFTGLMSNV